MERILVTGGCGFTGSHFCDLVYSMGMEVHVLDNLSTGSLSNVRDGLFFTKHDIRNEISLDVEFDYIVHFAAQGHVDDSIKDPANTISTNVFGTLNVLEFARKQKNLKRFIHISTDEVFGSSDGEEFHEYSRYNCTNPYSASKAGAEELVSSYYYTHGLPVYITHCSNIFGERQQDRALIPLCINKALSGDIMTIHARDGVIPRRKFVYVGDVVRVLHQLLYIDANRVGKVQKFNIIGNEEFFITEVCRIIYNKIGYEFTYIINEEERPCVDMRYLLQGGRLYHYTGWRPIHKFEDKIGDVIDYYRNRN